MSCGGGGPRSHERAKKATASVASAAAAEWQAACVPRVKSIRIQNTAHLPSASASASVHSPSVRLSFFPRLELSALPTRRRPTVCPPARPHPSVHSGPPLLLFIHTSISGGRKVCFVRCRSAASEISCLPRGLDHGWMLPSITFCSGSLLKTSPARRHFPIASAFLPRSLNKEGAVSMHESFKVKVLNC